VPKPKPDEIIRHEIVLGRTEREMMETVIAGITFNRVATPAVALLSDVSALSTIILILEATGVIDLDRGIFGDLLDQLNAGAFTTFQELQEAAEKALALYEAGIEFAEDPLKAKTRYDKAKTLVNRLGLSIVYLGAKLNPFD